MQNTISVCCARVLETFLTGADKVCAFKLMVLDFYMLVRLFPSVYNQIYIKLNMSLLDRKAPPFYGWFYFFVFPNLVKVSLLIYKINKTYVKPDFWQYYFWYITQYVNPKKKFVQFFVAFKRYITPTLKSTNVINSGMCASKNRDMELLLKWFPQHIPSGIEQYQYRVTVFVYNMMLRKPVKFPNFLFLKFPIVKCDRIEVCLHYFRLNTSREVSSFSLTRIWHGFRGLTLPKMLFWLSSKLGSNPGLFTIKSILSDDPI